MGEVIITMPVVDRANRPAFKPATTVRADIFEDSVDAGCTERTFMAADTGLPRVGRQVLSAIFTYGAQFKHVKSPAFNEARNNRTERLGICPANCRSSGKTTLSDIHRMTSLKPHVAPTAPHWLGPHLTRCHDDNRKPAAAGIAAGFFN